MTHVPTDRCRYQTILAAVRKLLVIGSFTLNYPSTLGLETADTAARKAYNIASSRPWQGGLASVTEAEIEDFVRSGWEYEGVITAAPQLRTGGQRGVGRQEALAWLNALQAGDRSSLAALVAAVCRSPLEPVGFRRHVFRSAGTRFAGLLAATPHDLRGLSASKLKAFGTEALRELCRQRGIEEAHTEGVETLVAKLIQYKKLV